MSATDAARFRPLLWPSAIAGSALLALAGLAAPWYVESARLPWVMPALLLGAAAVAGGAIWSRRERDAPAPLAPPKAPATDIAPDEMRRQLEVLRQTQAELLVAKQTAEAATMAKGEFLATMSHEIRTPLNGVLPLLELVLATPLAAEQRDYLSTAYASARELLRIVDAILDYSKLDADRLELESIGLNLRELVDGVAQLMQQSAAAKGLKIVVSIDPNVRLAVRGDPVRLRQVLTNLVSNAIKFTERGGVQIHVSKRGETREHHEIAFAIRDSGIGLAPEAAAKLFRPFSQADASTTRVFGGTGLGLAICKRLVDVMGGTIGVKSEPGKGSLFWFTVPLKKAIGDVAVRRDLNGLRAIAMIDDDAQWRRLQSFVASLGIEATQARTPADALARLRASASMGEKWRHALLLVDAAAFKPAYPALVRNVGKDPSLAHVETVLLGAASTGELADARVHAIAEPFADDLLRALIERAFGVRDPGAREDEPALPAAPAALAPKLEGRVLLVEDNEVNRRVAQRLIGLLGLEVVPVADGREAVERLAREPFDLVFMDCLMPVMDGFTATRTWREREKATGSNRRIPIVAMTANAMAGDRERCLASGMDDYLSKPLDRSALAATAQRWLEARDPSAARDVIPEAVEPTPMQVERAPERSAPNAIDAAIVQDLVDTMGEEFGALVRIYLEDAPQRVAALESAAERGDAAAQISPAHTLKSSSANIGATALAEKAKRIEHAARAGALTPLSEITGGVRGEYERVAAELQRLLDAAAS